MGEAVLPACQLFGLKWPSSGVFRIYVKAIGSMVGLMETSFKRTYATVADSF